VYPAVHTIESQGGIGGEFLRAGVSTGIKENVQAATRLGKPTCFEGLFPGAWGKTQFGGKRRPGRGPVPRRVEKIGRINERGEQMAPLGKEETPPCWETLTN